MGYLHTCHTIFVFLGFFIGVYIFGKGFLLSRSELANKAQCLKYNEDSHACLPIQFKKVVILLVDALKFDFIDPNLTYNSTIYWVGNLNVINDVIKQPKLGQPQVVQGIVSHFIADPPTTTLQRLKGLTTGGLPTFFDLSANFGGTEIGEDNILDQWNSATWKIIFMGDDTWMDLFPNRFHRSFPFPSFIVKDLDTVDNGIKKHLLEELSGNATDDWDVLIGHFLGIDHCGHTYGQNHPEMRRKQLELNHILEDVLSRVNNDTLVVLMGDHGMTQSGDHGGDSDPEVDAGLFLYSRRGFSAHNGPPLILSQIDLVPTLALLTGIPIPYSNLGVVHHNLLPLHLRTNAVIANARQIYTFLGHYNQQFGEDNLDPAVNLLMNELKTLLDDKSTKSGQFPVDRTVDILLRLRNIFRNKWTRFDERRICQGLFIFASSLILLCFHNNIRIIHLVAFVIAVSSALISNCIDDLTPISLVLCCVLTVISFAFLLSFTIRSAYRHLTSDIISVLFCLFVSFSVFSNSFIVNEDIVLRFLLHSLLLIGAIKHAISTIFYSNFRKVLVMDSKKILTGIQRRKYIILGILLALPLLSCLGTSIALHWRVCREEQFWCNTLDLTRSIASISDAYRSYKSWRFFGATLVLIVLVSVHYLWLSHLGNLNGTGWSVLAAYYLPTLAAACLDFHWTIQVLPERMLQRVPPSIQTIFPRLTLLLAGLGLCALVKWPLMFFAMINRDEDDLSLPRTSNWLNVVPHIYKKMVRRTTASGPDYQQPTLKVYGLGSIYSAWHLTTLLFIALIIVLFLGDGHIFSVALILATLFAFCGLHSFGFTRPTFDIATSWYSIGCMVLLSQYSFYVTGHQPTIPKIPWHAAYIIWHGEHTNHVLPALSVLLNTLAGPFLIVWCLPLLLAIGCPSAANPLTALAKDVTPITKGDVAKGKKVSTTGVTIGNGSSPIQNEGPFSVWSSGEFGLAESDLSMAHYRISLRTMMVRYLILLTVSTFCSLCAAGLHRRHLMVWKIFAPRMMFAVVCGAGNLLACGLTYITTLRLHSSVVAWRRMLEEQQHSL